MGEIGHRGLAPTSASTTVVRIGPFRVHLADREVFRDDERIPLTWRSFEALQVLIEANGDVVERDVFFGRLWPGVAIGESSLTQAIAKLRRELGEPSEGGLIETVARRGYRLTKVPEFVAVTPPDGPVVEQHEPAASLAARRFRPGRLALSGALLAVVFIGLLYAWPHWSRRAQASTLTDEGFRQIQQNSAVGYAGANRLFRQAIELDPSRALAYAGLAEVMARSVESTPGQAVVIAERAVRLDPRCASCQAILGWILFIRNWRFREGAQHLQQAIALDNRNPRTLLWHAQMLACSGRFDEALKEIERARSLDFKLPSIAAMRSGILYLSGRPADAIVAAHEALGLQPDYNSAYEWLYRSHLRLQHIGEAMAARAAMNTAYMGLSADSRIEEERRWMEAYHIGGVRQLMDTLLGECATKPGLDHQRYERATWRMFIGDRQGALDELEHLLDFRPFHVIYVGVDPAFAPLHGEPRFRALLSRIGLDGILTPQS